MTSSQHHSAPSLSRSLLSTAAAFALLLVPFSACVASSPYELDIRELEEGASPATSGKAKPRTDVKRTRAKVPADPGRPSKKDLEGEFVNYTIRPGDHIFKVLTERFGLSSARAEEMIPRILRVNGIRDVRGLQVGRTIRIPVTGKPAPPAAAENRADVPAPGNAGKTEAQAPEMPAAATAVLPPAGDGSSAVPAPPSLSPAAQKTIVRTVPAGDPATTADAIMDALALVWEKARPVTIPLGGSGASLTVPVDRYFEAQGKRFFLDFGGADPERATLVRLVEMAGYRKIQIGRGDDFRAVAEKLLGALGISSDYRRHLFIPAGGGNGELEVPGYLIVPPAGGGERLFLTDAPVTSETRDRAYSGFYEIK